jgi:hypothetical protein
MSGRAGLSERFQDAHPRFQPVEQAIRRSRIVGGHVRPDGEQIGAGAGGLPDARRHATP